MRETGEPILFPDNPAPHLTDWLLEIGPTVSGGMGEAPIGWQDMMAWQQLTGIELDVWEARLIRRLSIAFISQRHDSRKPDCPAPYSKELPEDARARVDKQFKALISAFGKK